MSFAYPVRTKILPIASSETLVIFFHGMFSGSLDPAAGPNIHMLSKRLIENNICTVGLYETSRNLLRDGRDFTVWAKESFVDKTFAMEKDDVGQALKTIVAQAPAHKKLIFIGFSLGGTLTTFFLDTYKPDAVVMFGSGCSTRNNHMPIGSTYPSKEEILGNLKNYSGILKIFQGTDDSVVPKEGAMQMIEAANLADRRDFVQLKGVDHRFMLRNGEPDPTLADFLYEEIIAVV